MTVFVTVPELVTPTTVVPLVVPLSVPFAVLERVILESPPVAIE